MNKFILVNTTIGINTLRLLTCSVSRLEHLLYKQGCRPTAGYLPPVWSSNQGINCTALESLDYL